MAGYLDVVGVGDSADYLKQLPDASMDSMVADPPAGIGFMGVGWDTFDGREDEIGRRGDGWDKPSAENARLHRREGRRFISEMTTIFQQCLRALKPGAHAGITVRFDFTDGTHLWYASPWRLTAADAGKWVRKTGFNRSDKPIAGLGVWCINYRNADNAFFDDIYVGVYPLVAQGSNRPL